MKDIRQWRLGLYTELRYKSNEHSGVAWGAIWEKLTHCKEKCNFSPMRISHESGRVLFLENKLWLLFLVCITFLTHLFRIDNASYGF